MLRVGLTGGLATGKSFVGRSLRDLGCLLIQADDLGHQVLSPGGEAYEAVLAEFGRGILADTGEIDRRKLAASVFGVPDRLAKLNSLVHPPVIARQEALIEEFAATHPGGVAVVEAAILIETGSYRRFQKLILTVCSEEQEVERAMHRDGITRQEALTRLDRQMPLSEKQKYADYIIDTSGTKENTLEQTREVYRSLLRVSQV